MKKLITILALLGLGVSINAMEQPDEEGVLGRILASPAKAVKAVSRYMAGDFTNRRSTSDDAVNAWLSLPKDVTKADVEEFMLNNRVYGDFRNETDIDGNTALDKLYMQELDEDYPLCVYLKSLGVTSKDEDDNVVGDSEDIMQRNLPVQRSLFSEVVEIDNDNLFDLDETIFNDSVGVGNDQFGQLDFSSEDSSDLDLTFIENETSEEDSSDLDLTFIENESSEDEVLDGELLRVKPETQLVLYEGPQNSSKKEQSYFNPMTIGLAALVGAAGIELVRRYVLSQKEETAK